MWITVDAQTNKKDDVKRETVYCLDDDNETEVQKEDIIQGVAMSALIRGLDELNMVAIVRYTYDRRSNPQVGAAFPCIKPEYEVRS
ncbi:hypothetical protein XENOCAPTIV_007431 [Xenoophorus captivus]|uniref:Ku domain-containing protein n=1 Tax=Xenoophorus captivus TaxID=1517983 RepID=A0ABV0R394_9TELE